MKNKIVSIILTICMAIPCLFSIVACDAPQEPTPLTEEQWTSAFAYLSNYSIMGGPSPTHADYGEFYCEENGVRIYTPNAPTSMRKDLYMRDNDGVYYGYVLVDGVWEVSIIEEEIYLYAKTYPNYFFLGFCKNIQDFDFTQNGYKSNKLINVSLNDTQDSSNDTVMYYDVDIKFNNQAQITAATWKQKFIFGGVMSEEYLMKLTVGDVSLTYPTIDSTVSATEWESALNLTNLNAVTLKINGVETVKFDGTNISIDYNFTEDSSVIIETIYQKSTSKYYYYDRNGVGDRFMAWSKQEIDETTYSSRVGALNYSAKLPYSLFEYDDQKDKYFAQTYTISGDTAVVITDAQVEFINGKCSRICYKENGKEYEILIVYGDVKINIPMDDDSDINLPYIPF